MKKSISANTFLVYVPILYPLKNQQNKGFLVFLGGIKWEHRPNMSDVPGQIILFCLKIILCDYFGFRINNSISAIYCFSTGLICLKENGI